MNGENTQVVQGGPRVDLSHANGDDLSLDAFRDRYVSRVLDLLDRNIDMAAGTLGLSAESLIGWRSHE